MQQHDLNKQNGGRIVRLRHALPGNHRGPASDHRPAVQRGRAQLRQPDGARTAPRPALLSTSWPTVGRLVGANWQKFTKDAGLRQGEPPPIPDAASPPRRRSAVSDGPKVKASQPWSGVILGPPQPLDYYATFEDLDSGRMLKWPSTGVPERRRPMPSRAWAAEEGYDLRGIEYKPEGSKGILITPSGSRPPAPGRSTMAGSAPSSRNFARVRPSSAARQAICSIDDEWPR